MEKSLNEDWPRIYSNQEVRVNENEMICRNIWAVSWPYVCVEFKIKQGRNHKTHICQHQM